MTRFVTGLVRGVPQNTRAAVCPGGDFGRLVQVVL